MRCTTCTGNLLCRALCAVRLLLGAGVHACFGKCFPLSWPSLLVWWANITSCSCLYVTLLLSWIAACADDVWFCKPKSRGTSCWVFVVNSSQAPPRLPLGLGQLFSLWTLYWRIVGFCLKRSAVYFLETGLGLEKRGTEIAEEPSYPVPNSGSPDSRIHSCVLGIASCTEMWSRRTPLCVTCQGSRPMDSTWEIGGRKVETWSWARYLTKHVCAGFKHLGEV